MQATSPWVRRLDPARVLSDLGRRVAELRADRGLTQEALAEALEVSSRYVQLIEAGEENLTVESFVGLANPLKVSLPEVSTPPTSRTVRVGRPPKPKARSSE